MLRASRNTLFRSTCRVLDNAGFSSHSKGAVPGQDDSMKGKLKTELKKALKINLVLVPILVLGCVFFFPTPSVEAEQQMIIEYEKNAGWKT